MFKPKETFTERKDRLVTAELSTKITELSALVVTERDRRLNEVGFTYEGKQIRADETSNRNLLSYVVQKDDSNVFPITWRCMDNTSIEIPTEAVLNQFSNQMLSFTKATFEDSFTVKDSIKVLTSIEEMEALYNEYIDS